MSHKNLKIAIYPKFSFFKHLQCTAMLFHHMNIFEDKLCLIFRKWAIYKVIRLFSENFGVNKAILTLKSVHQHIVGKIRQFFKAQKGHKESMKLYFLRSQQFLTQKTRKEKKIHPLYYQCHKLVYLILDPREK